MWSEEADAIRGHHLPGQAGQRGRDRRNLPQASAGGHPVGSWSQVSVRPVAVIGLGGMGSGMARALLDNGFPVTVYNRTAAKAAPLVEQGAVLAPSAGDAGAGADVVVLSLADEHAV